MNRTSLWGWAAAAAIAPMLLASAVWANSAQPDQHDADRPANEASNLDCGGGMVIVYHADLYLTKDEDQQKAAPAATGPDEAVARLLNEVYPGAARERAFRRVPANGQARYEASSSRGQRAAILVVGEQEGQYFVEDVAICENLAARWAK